MKIYCFFFFFFKERFDRFLTASVIDIISPYEWAKMKYDDDSDIIKYYRRILEDGFTGSK